MENPSPTSNPGEHTEMAETRMSLCSPGTYPVTGETLHEAEDGAVEDVGDDAAVALLLPPPAAGARHLGWGQSTGLGLRRGGPGACLARTRVRST